MSGAYRNRTDDLLTARDNSGFSTGLHYTLLHYKNNEQLFFLYTTPVFRLAGKFAGNF